MPQPQPGDRFTFIYLDQEACQPCQAVVHRVLSNADEGLSSPEADFYVAEWLEAVLLNSAAADQSITMMLSADCKTSIDGRPVSVTFEDSSS